MVSTNMPDIIIGCLLRRRTKSRYPSSKKRISKGHMHYHKTCL
jgi:hypothetical protein